MPYGKEQYVMVECPKDPEVVQELCNQVMISALFGFLQVDIHIPDDLKERFSKSCPLFIMNTIPEEAIPSHMKEYWERTERKTIKENSKAFGHQEHEKALAVHDPVTVVPHPWPESNRHS